MSNRIKNNNWASDVDWAFLLFLVGVVNVKLYVKMFTVVAYIIYTWFKKYPFKKLNDINKFYLLIPVLGTVGSLLHGSFQTDSYLLGYALGVAQWLTAFLISYAIYITVVHVPKDKLVAVLKLFFAVNIALSLGELLYMTVVSKHFPYWYWEPTEYYGTSTGDHIKGLFRSNSITNAMVSTLGVVYFLYQKEIKWAIACLLVVLMCTSNISIAFLLFAVFLVFVFVRKKKVRKQAIIISLLTLLMYPVLTPLNLKYIATTYNKQLEEREIAQIRSKKADTVSIKKDVSHIPVETPYQSKHDYFIVGLNKSIDIDYAHELAYLKYFATKDLQENSNVMLQQHVIKGAMERWYGVAPQYSPLSSYYKPAKIYTFRQTQYYLQDNWKNALFGAGIGNYSSKLAIKMTNLGLQGSYPDAYRYVSNDFLSGHFYSLLYVLAKPVSEHSIIQMPYSVYNQVAGEYGLIGFVVLAWFYLGFCIKNYKRLKAGRYLFVLTLIFFGFEYWFEMMSLTILFEFLIFLDIYKNRDADTGAENISADAGV